MNRMIPRLAVGAGALLLLLLAFTPAGLWIASRILSHLAAGQGWRIEIADRSGSLSTGFSLKGLTISDDQGTTYAFIDQIVVDPWSYGISLRQPEIRLVLPGDEKTEKERKSSPFPLSRIPVSRLPDVDLIQGSLGIEWKGEPRNLEIRDLNLRYRASGDTTGDLRIVLRRTELVQRGKRRFLGSIEGSIHLSPEELETDSLEMRATWDTLRISTALCGKIHLGAHLPVEYRIRSRLCVPSGTLRANVEIEGRGKLQPVELLLSMDGQLQLPPVGAITAAGCGEVNEERIRLDSLCIGLLEGTLRLEGEYFSRLDSLSGDLTVHDVDLGCLPGNETGGVLNGDLKATLGLASKQYELALSTVLRQVQLIRGRTPVDMALSLIHHPDQSTRIELHSSLLDLKALGRLNPEGLFDSLCSATACDLQISGTAYPAALSGLTSPPIQIEGEVRPVRTNIRLFSPHLPVPFGDRFGAWTADLELTENCHLKIASSIEDTLLSLRADLDLSRASLDSLVLSLSPTDMDRFAGALHGEIWGQVRASGALTPKGLHLNGQLESNGIGWKEWQSSPLLLALSYEKGRASCRLKGDGLLADVAWEAGDLLTGRAVFNGPFLRSMASSRCDTLVLRGRLDWKSESGDLQGGKGDLRLDEIAWRSRGQSVRALRPVVLSYENHSLHLDPTEFSTPMGRVRIDGGIRKDTLKFLVDLPHLKIEDPLGRMHVEGTGGLQLSGTMRQPFFSGRIRLDQVILDSLDLGKVEVSIATRDRLIVRSVLYQGEDDPSAEAELSLPAGRPIRGEKIDEDLRVSFVSRRLDLRALLTFLFGRESRGWIEGKGDFSIPLDSLRRPDGWRDVRGSLSFQNLEIQTLAEGDSLHLVGLSNGSIRTESDRLVLSGLQVALERYDREKGRFLPAGQAQLEGSLSDPDGTRLNLSIEGFDLLTLRGPEGKADLKVLVEGAFQAPDVQAELSIATEDLGRIDGRLRGNGSGGSFWIDWITPADDSLFVRGVLPWDWQRGRIDPGRAWLTAFSKKIDLSAFSGLFADLDRLGGRLSVDLRMDHLTGDVDLKGHLIFEDLTFVLLGIQPACYFPRGKVLFDGRRGVLRDFASPSRKGNGSMALSGYIDLSRVDEPRFSLRLKTEDLRCQYEDVFTAPDIDMSIRLEGSKSASLLSGRIRLNEPTAEAVLVSFNAPPVPPPPPTLRNEFMENMRLDVMLDIRKMKVDSELAQVQVSGGVDIGGTFYKPVFQGDVEIDEGQVFVLNRQFDFDKGRIVLNSLVPTRSILDVAYDPMLLDPELDLSASCSVTDQEDGTDYTVTLNVQGTARNPAPEFQSDPALDFNGIFRLLAFGSAASQQLEYTTAIGTAAGQLLSKHVERVGLDEFTVLPSSDVIGSSPGIPAVRMGKYFDRPLPLWIRYEAVIDDISSGEVRLEHRLKPYLILTGSAQSKYDRYGLGIGLKKDF